MFAYDPSDIKLKSTGSLTRTGGDTTVVRRSLICLLGISWHSDLAYCRIRSFGSSIGAIEAYDVALDTFSLQSNSSCFLAHLCVLTDIPTVLLVEMWKSLAI